jgi:hypothetical protein
LPSFKVHAYVDKQLLGKVYTKVHLQMDSAVPYLGARHRILYHDPFSVSAIAWNTYPGDAKAQLAAFLHIIVDRGCSAYPVFRVFLEWLAEMDAGNK